MKGKVELPIEEYDKLKAIERAAINNHISVSTKNKEGEYSLDPSRIVVKAKYFRDIEKIASDRMKKKETLLVLHNLSREGVVIDFVTNDDLIIQLNSKVKELNLEIENLKKTQNVG